MDPVRDRPTATVRSTHHCVVFDDDVTAPAVFGRFAADGLRAGGQVIIATRWPPERVRPAIGGDAADAEASGQLELQAADDCYAGRTGADQVAWLRDTAAAARSNGWTSLWVAADATVQAGATDPDEFLDYEMLVDRLLLDVDVVGLCAYDRRELPAARLDHLGACHPSCEGAPVPGVVVADPRGVRVRGELDAANAAVATRLLARPDLSAGDVIDVADLRFVDLAGARALLRAIEAHRRDGRELGLRHPQPEVRTVLELLGASDTVVGDG